MDTEYNWPRMYRGATYGPIQFTVYAPNGAFQNLTGWDFFCQMVAADGTQVLDLQPAVSNDPTTGVVTVRVEPVSTANIPIGSYDVDLLMRDGSGLIYPPVAKGRITVLDTVSKATL